MKRQLKHYIFFISLLLVIVQSHAQLKESSKWKALFAVGFNAPSANGFIEDAAAKTVNLPTVNLGVQHMFKRTYGVKLDYGFNRFKLKDISPEVKINYSRINAQFVFNPTDYLGFLPPQLQAIVHAGPGFSFVKPLQGLEANKQSYLNLLGGLELHYAISEKVSVYTDLAYIYGLTSLDDYDPVLTGLGAFNGNVFNLTFGVAVSLSGCQFCD